MSKAIIRYWRDEKFGNEMSKTITELLILAKSNKIKNSEFDEILSEFRQYFRKCNLNVEIF